MNSNNPWHRYQICSIRLLALLLSFAFVWRSAKRLVFTEWSLPIWKWLWWPLLAMVVAAICLALDTRNSPPDGGSRTLRWIYMLGIAALLLFVTLGWIIADSGPGFMVNPVQYDDGLPGGWVSIGGMLPGRSPWQPAFLAHLETGVSTRVGYYPTFSGLTSPPSLLEFSISHNEHFAAWVEPEETWWPWPSWFEWETDRSFWPMRLVVADVRGGHIRRSAAVPMFPDGAPSSLAISPDGSHVAALDLNGFTILSTTGGSLVAELTSDEITGSDIWLRGFVYFIAPDRVSLYLKEIDDSLDERRYFFGIYEINLTDLSVAHTGTVEVSWWAHHLFVDPNSNATYFLVVHNRDHVSLHDGRTGVLLASDEDAYGLVDESLGFDLLSFVEPMPSNMSKLPVWFANWIYRVQVGSFWF